MNLLHHSFQDQYDLLIEFSNEAFDKSMAERKRNGYLSDYHVHYGRAGAYKTGAYALEIIARTNNIPLQVAVTKYENHRTMIFDKSEDEAKEIPEPEMNEA
jgi:hypothetical protein